MINEKLPPRVSFLSIKLIKNVIAPESRKSLLTNKTLRYEKLNEDLQPDYP
jgi:hypothetical protein